MNKKYFIEDFSQDEWTFLPLRDAKNDSYGTERVGIRRALKMQGAKTVNIHLSYGENVKLKDIKYLRGLYVKYTK